MALRTLEHWKNFFTELSFSNEVSTTYANAFVDNEITELSLRGLTRTDLQGIGITKLGHLASVMASISSRLQQTNIGNLLPKTKMKAMTHLKCLTYNFESLHLTGKDL